MGGTALIVDNDFFFVEFLGELLEKRGYGILKAYDGKQAISRLEQGTIDLLFVDLVMPKIDGRQVIRYTRERFPDGEVSIVVVSGALIEQADAIEQIEADYYIVKGPLEEMSQRINSFMDRLEEGPFLWESEDIFIDSGDVHPNQVIVELTDRVDFHKAVLEGLGAGVIVVDRDAKVISTNRAAVDYLGRTWEWALNRHITTLFPKEERANVVKALKEVIQNRTLEKVVFGTRLHSRRLKVVASLFRIEGKVAGWLLGLCE